MSTRRTLLAGLAALPLTACVTAGAGAGASDLKLVTFNIWHNQGDWAARLPLLVAALRAADADVIALQEVLEDAAVGLPNQAQTLADALGGYSVHFVSTDAEGAPRRYGNAILSRLPVVQADWRKLAPLDDYRTAQRLRLRHGGRLIDIVNTHLHWTVEGGAIRAEQVSDLLAWLPRDGTPLAILGDLNAPLANPELSGLRGPRFIEAFTALHPDQIDRTTLNPAKGHKGAHIDQIIVEAAHFTPVQAAIIGDRATNGEYPSDHFGVEATLRLR